jgi:hypothetical protein
MPDHRVSGQYLFAAMGRVLVGLRKSRFAKRFPTLFLDNAVAGNGVAHGVGIRGAANAGGS